MSSDVLVIAAHSDDEVLGCGGTISKLASKGLAITTVFLTNGVGSRRSSEMKQKAKQRQNNSRRAADILGIKNIIQLDFEDQKLDVCPLLQITQELEDIIDHVKPNTVFTHYVNDLNSDHALVAKATLTATRPMTGCTVKKLFAFEVNSSTEWAFGNPAFAPNYFVDITETFDRKIAAMCSYEEELRSAPHPRSLDAIKALACLRGNASGYQYAEAFKIYRFLED